MSVWEILSLASRWLHILGGGILIGGMILARFAVLPAAATLPEDARGTFREEMRRRRMILVMVAITLLMLTGLANFVMLHAAFKRAGAEMPTWYHAMFGTKFLLAMVVFYLSSLLVGRSETAQRLCRKEKLWLNVNLILILAIVCLAGTLRLAHHDIPQKDSPVAVSPR